MHTPTGTWSDAEKARFVRERLPAGGLFADLDWRIGPAPFVVGPALAAELETLGRVLLQFYRATDRLYRQSVAGEQPGWIAALLDQGKPPELIALQRCPAFKGDTPRVIRPDILLTDEGFSITELDSVPGGIGLTAWLNETYAQLAPAEAPAQAAPGIERRDAPQGPPRQLVGDALSMIEGFQSLFPQAARVHIVVSEEAAAYRPEMRWLAARLGDRFAVRDGQFQDFQPGEAAYRFFELFDTVNVPAAPALFDLAAAGQIQLTPPPKPLFEEKLLFTLLWNRNLREFWRRELGEKFFLKLQRHVPYSWALDPAPLPPHGAVPELGLTDWHQLKSLSQRERELVLKVSGFSPEAWGARGVFLGSDLSREQWSAAVDRALAGFGRSPYVLQRYHKPRTVEAAYFDFAADELKRIRGRVRLCPYYFVSGRGDQARARLCGALATICPADKKIIHGMSEAILAPAAATWAAY